MPGYSRADYDEEMEIIEQVNQGISRLVASGQMTGLESLKANATIEQAKRQAKGKLLSTVRFAGDTRMKGKNKIGSCASPSTHLAGCMCKKLHKFQIGEE